MVQCVIVEYTSRYKNNKDKLHQFCIPKDLNFRGKKMANAYTQKIFYYWR